MSVRGPLAYRVAYLTHDDDDRMLYRDFDTFVRALLEALDQDEAADDYKTADLFFGDADGDVGFNNVLVLAIAFYIIFALMGARRSTMKE